MPKHADTLIIDFGGGVLRILVAQSHGTRSVVHYAKSFPLQREEGGAMIDDPKWLAGMLNAILKSEFKKRSPTTVRVVLPDATSFVFGIRVAVDAGDNMTEAVQWELNQHVPFDPSELYFDWYQVPDGDGPPLIQVAAATRASVDHVLEVVDQAGLVPSLFVPTSLALANAERKHESDIVLVHIDHFVTTIAALHHGVVLYAFAEKAFSHQSMTAAVQTKLALRKKNALRAMEEIGVMPGGDAAVHDALIESLRAIGPTLQHVKSLSVAGVTLNIRETIVSGCGTDVRGIEEKIGELIGTPARIASLAKDVHFLEKKGSSVASSADIYKPVIGASRFSL